MVGRGRGRMGANRVRRLMTAGRAGVVHDRSAGAVAQLTAGGAVGAASVAERVAKLKASRAVGGRPPERRL